MRENNGLCRLISNTALRFVQLQTDKRSTSDWLQKKILISAAEENHWVSNQIQDLAYTTQRSITIQQVGYDVTVLIFSFHSIYSSQEEL